MLDVRRLPTAVVASTFALSGLVATTGVTSVALGVGRSDSFCTGVDAARPAGGILDCLGPSTGYVETPLGSGSALVLDGGYLLTNAHVVDPFGVVTVTIGEESHEDVPVVGVDQFADIAVLGPVETEARAVELVDPKGLRKGDALFLVGYPGEANTEDLEPTVADGILSRTRTSKAFDLHYLQTDASIGGGQSGGALVDITGGVVGISSLRFAERFSLALSAADAQAAVDRILAGEGTPYRAWPGAEPVTEVAVSMPDDLETEMVNIPVAAEERTIDVTVPADLPILVVSSSLEQEDPIQVQGNKVAILSEVMGIPQSRVASVKDDLLTSIIEDAELAELVSPGVFRFRVPANEHVSIEFGAVRLKGLDFTATTSIPVAPMQTGEPVAFELGQEVKSTVDTLVPWDEYRLHLEAGQKVRVEVSSPSGDMQVVITAPDGSDKDFDDSRKGLYGLDVDEVYTAPVAGEYRFEVGQTSEMGTGYRLAISAA